jgi:hypothetical protein
MEAGNGRLRRFGKKTAILTIGALGLFAASVAFASWLASGSGSGYAKASTAAALTTVDASASTTAQLFPGGTGDVFVKVHNPNGYKIQITSVTGTGAATADSGHSGCTTTGVSFTDQTGLTQDVAAGGDTLLTFTGAAAMSNASLNACQGATFTIPVSLAGTSNP